MLIGGGYKGTSVAHPRVSLYYVDMELAAGIPDNAAW